MEIYILRDGTETGPFSEETTHQMLKQGAVLINDLAWRPGMPEWIPLHSVLYPAPEPVTPPPAPTQAAPAPVSTEPATAKQKVFLSYMGIETPADVSKEQAALLVNDAMEDPKNAARVTRWNDERLKLHPDLFAAELQAKKEERPQQYLELCQTEGAEALEGVTKAHCQVLVGYLDVKFPNWDSNETEGAWNYFFPAVGEKFPQLVRKGWKDKLKYPQGPKVAPELKRRTPVATTSSPKRKGPSPVASLAKGLFFGLVIVGLGAGGLYVSKHPELLDRAKALLAAVQQPSKASTSGEPKAKPAATPASGSASDNQSLFSSSPTAGAPTASAPVAGTASTNPATSQPMVSAPVAAAGNPNDAGTMNSAPALPEATPASGTPSMSLFDTPPSASSATGSTPENNAAASALPAQKTTVVLIQPYELQLPYGKIKVPAGTPLRIVEQDGVNLKVRFQNQVVSVPVSATDLGGEATPQ
ncbi:GYF domain-containing protein [Verrucomicrobiota bacterium sgz303538]